MLLKSDDEWEFQLQILGYEYPEIVDSEYDSNWLMISLRGRAPGGSWQATDPCLLTWEVVELAAWLGALADPTAEAITDTLEFSEPTLSFELAGKPGEMVTLRVNFGLDVRPTWAPGHAARIESWIELQLTSYDLQTAATSLLSQLSKFPPRANARAAPSPPPRP